MAVDSGLIQGVLSVATVIGLFGYIGHSVWSEYNKFRDDIYNKVEKKLDVEQCDKYRAAEDKVVERIDRDLQQHKEDKR